MCLRGLSCCAVAILAVFEAIAVRYVAVQRENDPILHSLFQYFVVWFMVPGPREWETMRPSMSM